MSTPRWTRRLTGRCFARREPSCGPLKGRFGYFVFKVLKISPARQQTLAQASHAIRQLLTVDRQAAAAEAFDAGLRAKSKPQTTCRRGFVVNLCAGTPEPDQRRVSPPTV